MTIVAKEWIRHSGKLFKSGDAIDGLTPQEEDRLISLDSAFRPIDYSKKASEVEIEVDKDYFSKYNKLLDSSFDAESLQKVAKKCGVSLQSTRKKDVIEAIIKQGKAELILEIVSE